MKEFKVEDLFEVNPTQAYKDLLDEYIISPNGKTPFVTTTASNNGVKGYSEYPPLNAGNAITISDTTGTDSVFYQAEPFIGRSHVQGLYPKLEFNRFIACYIITAIKKSIDGRYSYGAKFNRDTIKQTTISLPVQSLSDTEPDWACMEEYMKDIEKKTILKVKEENDREIARLKELVGVNEGGGLEELEYAEFRVGDLFGIENTTSFNKDSLVPCDESNRFPYITRTSENNGIIAYTGLVPDGTLNESCTFSLGLLQMDFFYQKEQWYAGQFVRKVIPKFATDDQIILYMKTALSKIKPKLLSVLVRDVDKVFLNETIVLPVSSENKTEPDWSFMQRHMGKLELDMRNKIGL